MKTKIDFIIVGAQKAGTTSLASYLGANPRVFIPPEKEIPFFLDVKIHGKGWDRFVRTYFRHADPGGMWGTSTPQYMMYPECFAAIASALPEVKIIAILRDPVARMLSHFDMAVRFGVEDRSLNEAIRVQLERIDACRRSPYNDRTGKYVAAGEYGRILGELFRYFDRGRVLVLQFDDLRRDPRAVVGRLCGFLEIEPFIPDGVGEVRMRGGAGKRIDIDTNRLASALSGCVRALGMERLISDRLKARTGRLLSKIDEWNVDPRKKSSFEDLETDLLARLFELYERDAERLARMDVPAPWLDGWRGRGTEPRSGFG